MVDPHGRPAQASSGRSRSIIRHWVLCNLRGAACTFLVITDGGKGNCVLGDGACGSKDTGGAPPNSVGAFRLAEMDQSVTYFHGTLVALALEDTPSSTVVGAAQNWNQRLSGIANDAGIELITQKIADAIARSKPDIIVTFDPRHGVYCHPDHRAAGALTVRAAVAQSFDLTRVSMVETTEFYADSTNNIVSRAWVPGDPFLIAYDANAASWPAHAAVWAAHKSQYTPDLVKALLDAPAAVRGVPLLAASNATLGDQAMPTPAYDAICASEDAAWDGHGVCPKADGGVGICW